VIGWCGVWMVLWGSGIRGIVSGDRAGCRRCPVGWWLVHCALVRGVGDRSALDGGVVVRATGAMVVPDGRGLLSTAGYLGGIRI
jgi:hypothetical protein